MNICRIVGHKLNPDGLFLYSIEHCERCGAGPDAGDVVPDQGPIRDRLQFIVAAVRWLIESWRFYRRRFQGDIQSKTDDIDIDSDIPF